MPNELGYLAAVVIIVVLFFLAIYISGERAVKKRKIDTKKENEEFEKISIEVTGKKVDTSKTEIIGFEVSVPIIFRLTHKVTVWDNVNGCEYRVEAFEGKEQDGMVITSYKARVYKEKEVVIRVTVTTVHLYKKEKEEIIDI